MKESHNGKEWVCSAGIYFRPDFPYAFVSADPDGGPELPLLVFGKGPEGFFEIGRAAAFSEAIEYANEWIETAMEVRNAYGSGGGSHRK